MNRSPVLLAWRAANNFGWGVAGLNIFHQWALSPDVGPLMAYPIRDVFLTDQDGPALQAIFTAIVNSNKFAQRIAGGAGLLKLDIPVVHALGNRFASGVSVVGRTNFGRCVFEDTDIRNGAGLAGKYDAMICASTWNAEILKAQSSVPVHIIHETVDHALFFPAPKAGLFSPGRFHIFTGGKIEFRKAQDLVLLAFRRFSERHDDAVLVTAWHSPWDASLAGFKGRLDAPAQVNGEGRLDVKRWAADNGVDPGKVIDLGPLANQSMPMLLREMDCALQPGRRRHQLRGDGGDGLRPAGDRRRKHRHGRRDRCGQLHPAGTPVGGRAPGRFRNRRVGRERRRGNRRGVGAPLCLRGIARAGRRAGKRLHEDQDLGEARRRSEVGRPRQPLDHAPKDKVGGRDCDRPPRLSSVRSRVGGVSGQKVRRTTTP